MNWAVRALRVSSSNVDDDTQLHTHMCYAEFNDIIKDIAAMDADVITIATSRSQIWVNPDCGLKTRAWPETKAALKAMVEAAKILRAA